MKFRSALSSRKGVLVKAGTVLSSATIALGC